MEYNKLPGTDIQVSKICLGTMTWGRQNSESEAFEQMDYSLDKGVNFFDTAELYPVPATPDRYADTERIIGNWLESRKTRDKIVLASKIAGPGDYTAHIRKTGFKGNSIEEAINGSLERLKTDYIDLIYLHHCNFGKEDEYLESALDVLRSFQSEGKIRFIGLSDWSNERIVKYIDICDPDVVQPYRNIMDNSYEKSGLKSIIDGRNLGVCFFSPIKHGLLTGKYKSPTFFKEGDHRSNIKDFQNEKILRKILLNCEELKKKFKNKKNPVLYGVVNALFLDSPTSCVLLGQRNVEQVEVASSLGDVLSSEDTTWVKSLYDN